MKKAIMLGLIVVSGCQTPATPTSSVKDEEAPGPLVAPEVVEPCDAVAPLAKAKDLTAERLHDLSRRCIFNDSFHDVKMTVLSETFKKVLDDGCNEVESGYGHAIEVVIDGVRIPDVGFKVRGNTSKCNPKRQFKLKFDAKKAFSKKHGVVTPREFPANKDRRFFGVAALNLRASNNDPAMLREHVSSSIFEAAAASHPVTKRGALVYDTTFTKVFVSFNRKENEGKEGKFTRLFDGKFFDYKGIYTLAENIDDVFLHSRFGEGEDAPRNHFLFAAALKRAFFERDTYRREGWVPEYVDGKEAKTEEDLAAGDAKLFQLFDVLRPDATDTEIEALIDVDAVVNYFAAIVLSGHWDSMVGNRNNDLLFFDGVTGKWKIVTWDLDNSLGVIKAQYDGIMQDDLYHPAEQNPAKLFETLFAEGRPAFRERLRSRVQELFSGIYASGTFDAFVGSAGESLRQNAEEWEGLRPQLFKDVMNFAKARRTKLAAQVGGQ